MQNRADLDRAFSLCSPHPRSNNNSLLITSNPAGVPALAIDECKSVIWRRGLSPVLKAAVDSMTIEEISGLHEKCGQRRLKGRFDPTQARQILPYRGIFNDASTANVLAADVEMLTSTLQTVTSDYQSVYAWFHGHLFITGRYHADRIPVIRAATVYKGRGLRIIPTEVSPEDYQLVAAKRITVDNEYIEDRYPFEDLEVGDVLFSKAWADGGISQNRQSTVHVSVSEEEGVDRLFLGIDLYQHDL